LKTKFYEFGGSLDKTEWVWLQILVVSDDLEFYKIGLK